MDNLPHEILVEIGKYLNSKSLENMCYSSKRMYRTFSLDILWKMHANSTVYKPKNYMKWVLCKTSKKCFGCCKKTTISCELVDNYLCKPCHDKFSHISMSQVKKMYFLDEYDVRSLPHERIKCQYRFGTFYLESEIEKLAIDKHGGQENFDEFINEKENKKQRRLEAKTNNQVIRKDRIDILRKKYSVIPSGALQEVIETYLSSGKGIRNVEICFKKHIIYKSIRDKIHYRIYDDFMYDKITEKDLESRIQRYEFELQECNRREQLRKKAKEERKIERKTRLTEALRQRNLTFRNDSKLCQQYIDGSSTNLDEIVDIMEEMKWFCEKTDYLVRVKKNLENAFNNRNAPSGRRTHEPWDDYDWDYDCYIDPEVIKYNTKESCFKFWMNNNPGIDYPEILNKYDKSCSGCKINYRSSSCSWKKCGKCCPREKCPFHKKVKN